MGKMMTFVLLVIAGLLWIKALWLGALSLTPSSLSQFELRRRSTHSTKARDDLWRNETLRDARALQRIILVILAVVISALLMGALGWIWGMVAAIGAGIVYVGLSSRAFVGRVADKLFLPYEIRILHIAEKMHLLLRPFHTFDGGNRERVDSREHLSYLVENSEDVFSEEERQLLSHAMRFPHATVSAVMTPRKDIKMVKKSEFLGPLVLDELHSHGHSHLPVIGKDIDHIVGMLDVRGLLSLDITRSMTAEKAMDKKVIFIQPSDSLEDALALFLDSHQHICVVRNGKQETVGLVTLGDVIAALLGRRIVNKG